ncbi:AC117-like protein [Orgyia pseudotsugata single capsid nuclopolyhedrovirus]|nr:AC117-like protein [Orgyia pseudotsugata single capsid nuclopolyhedrovirus]
MNLVVFVVHISNPNQLLQSGIYEKYLVCFDVVDAIMCNSGECLAICLSVRNSTTDLPICFEQFVASPFNDGVCELKILEIGRYENVESIQTNVYDTVEVYNKERMVFEPRI